MINYAFDLHIFIRIKVKKTLLKIVFRIQCFGKAKI